MYWYLSHANLYVYLMVAISTGMTKMVTYEETAALSLWNYYEKTIQCFELQSKRKKIHFRSIPPWPHTHAGFLHSTAQLKDSESANQYEPNLICGADVWPAMRQAESCDVTGWNLRCLPAERGDESGNGRREILVFSLRHWHSFPVCV